MFLLKGKRIKDALSSVVTITTLTGLLFGVFFTSIASAEETYVPGPSEELQATGIDFENYHLLEGDEKIEADKALHLLGIAPPTITPGLLPNTFSCFDYYSFGSVDVNISSAVESTVSGVPISFHGELFNRNPYPLVDMAVYVKVYRTSFDQEKIQTQGHDIVDQFYAVKGLTIDARSGIPIGISWDVPSNLPSGSYHMVTYAVSAERFNLLGLSFTDDIGGNTVPFVVNGESERGIEFDRDSVTLNGEKYRMIGAPPIVSGTDPIEIAARISNFEDRNMSDVPIKITAYAWDGLRESAIVYSGESTVDLDAGTVHSTSFTLEDTQFPVYFVTAEIGFENQAKSVLNVRFVRHGVDAPRINFPGVSTYPIEKGESYDLYSCVHGAGNAGLLSGGRMELEIVDTKGNLVHSFVYEGDITGEMMAVRDNFVSGDDLTDFDINATLYHNNNLIDSVTLEYRCEDINPDGCTTGGDVYTPESSERNSLGSGLLVTVLILVLLLVAAIVATRLTKSKVKKDVE